MNETFSELMSESDQAGNIHKIPKTTYYRARIVWRARLSTDPTLATKAQEMINKLDLNTTSLNQAVKFLGLEAPSQKNISSTTIQRIAATLDGITQATSGINNLNYIEPTEETAELAIRITKACKEILRIAKMLQRR